MTTALRIVQGSFGRVALLDMDRPLVPHAHSQCHVVLKASGADACFHVQGRRLPVTDRNAILVNAWEPHHYQHEPSAPRTVWLALYVEPRWLAAIHRPLQLSGRPDFFPRPCVEITPQIRQLADDLVIELVSAGELPQERLESMLFELMIALIDSFSGWRRMMGSEGSIGAPRMDARINRVIEYIKVNLGRPLDMDRLAYEAHLSRAQFFVCFRCCTRMTPNVFINMLRAEHACRVLADPVGRPTLGQLSSELGFSDQASFTRFIRGHVGVTPSQYRRVVDLYDSAPSVADH